MLHSSKFKPARSWITWKVFELVKYLRRVYRLGLPKGRQKHSDENNRDQSTLRGPNYWSNYRRKLIAKLDIEGTGKRTAHNKIAGFTMRSQPNGPLTQSQIAAQKTIRRFLKERKRRKPDGPRNRAHCAGNTITAGIEAGFGRTRNNRVYNVVFSYMEEKT